MNNSSSILIHKLKRQTLEQEKKVLSKSQNQSNFEKSKKISKQIDEIAEIE